MKAGGRLTTLVDHLRPTTKVNKGVRSMTTGGTAPRWQRVIEKALEEDGKANVYQLATLDSTISVGGTKSGLIPRVRSLIHRAFLAPRSPAHPLLLTTTDARTPKTTQLAQDSRVEIAWWLPQALAQMRITGTAHVLPAPNFVLAGAESASEEKKQEIESTVDKLSRSFMGVDLGGAGFDWEAERRARFDAMGGHMRASWVRPVPGTRLVDPRSAESWPESLPKLAEAAGNSKDDGGAEKSTLVEEALRNFALVLIDPLEVDYVELGVVPNRRTRFFKEGEEWREEALVP